MKTAAFAIALLLGGAAIAQTATQPDANADLNADTLAVTTPDSDASTTQTDMSPQSDLSDTSATEDNVAATTPADAATPMDTTAQQQMMATNMAPASDQIVQPGNADPEHDARGIKVISAEATVPPGWNGIAGAAEGGPLLDPATGEAMAPDNYPACSATVTDNCLQTYERGRSA